MISNQNNLFLSTHFLPNLNQRHRINKALTIKTSNFLFNKYYQSSQQKIQSDLHQESPLLIRPLRPTIENHSSSSSSSQHHILKNQLQLTSRTSLLHSKIDKKIHSNSKSHLLRYSNTHYQSRIEKKTSISDLFISPRSIKINFQIIQKTNVKNSIDEWEDPKSNVAVSSDDDNDDDDSFISKSPENLNQCTSPIFIPNNLQRYGHSFSLAPVLEDINDE